MIRQIAVSVRLILLSLLAVAAGAFAVENIDCINYEGEFIRFVSLQGLKQPSRSFFILWKRESRYKRRMESLLIH